MLQVSTSSYYAYHNGQTYRPSDHKTTLLKEVKSIFDFHKRRYGSRRIHSELQDKGYDVGRHQVRSLMRAQQLVAIQPKSFIPRTTQSDPSLCRSPNMLLSEDNLPTAPDEVLVGDITYLPSIAEGIDEWLYLAIWMDLFTRKIVGWHVDEHMEDLLVLTALKKVIYNRSPEARLIVHSDGGGQYGSKNFRKLLSWTLLLLKNKKSRKLCYFRVSEPSKDATITFRISRHNIVFFICISQRCMAKSSFTINRSYYLSRQ